MHNYGSMNYYYYNSYPDPIIMENATTFFDKCLLSKQSTNDQILSFDYYLESKTIKLMAL